MKRVPLFTTASTESARLAFLTTEIRPRAICRFSHEHSPPSRGIYTLLLQPHLLRASWPAHDLCPVTALNPSTDRLQHNEPFLYEILNFGLGERTLLAIVHCHFSHHSFLGGIPGHPLSSSRFLSMGLASPCFLSLPNSRWCHLLSPVSHWFPILQLQVSSTPFIL